MIQGVIFDLDGLMFDTERMWATFWEPALAPLGLPYRDGLDEDARGTAGETMRAVLRKYYGPDCDTEAILDSLHAVADKAFASPAPKKPGLDELLAYLKAKGIPMAVASSSREDVVRRHLRNGSIEAYFDVVLAGGMVQRSKPAPDIFLLAAQKLGVRPADCLVLEDSYNGVRAGHAGGFVTIMVPDLLPADEEMRALYTTECVSLHAVRRLLEETGLCPVPAPRPAVKAIFFDIDGTLVSFKTHEAPASTMRALYALREKGVKLFISSGRPPVWLDVLREQLHDFPFDGYVLLNGQYCTDAAGQPFHVQPLPTGAFASLLPWLEANPDVVCSFVEMDYAYENRHTEAVQTTAQQAGLYGPHAPVEDPVRALTHTTYQLNPYIPPERDTEFIAHAPGCKAVRWNDIFADVIPADGGKPEGVKRMLDRFGLTAAECMAFGDGGNDIDMLRFAGIGVAMGNAAPPVKAAADYVTDDIDADGLEKALVHFGLL